MFFMSRKKLAYFSYKKKNIFRLIYRSKSQWMLHTTPKVIRSLENKKIIKGTFRQKEKQRECCNIRHKEEKKTH